MKVVRIPEPQLHFYCSTAGRLAWGSPTKWSTLFSNCQYLGSVPAHYGRYITDSKMFADCCKNKLGFFTDYAWIGIVGHVP